MTTVEKTTIEVSRQVEPNGFVACESVTLHGLSLTCHFNTDGSRFWGIGTEDGGTIIISKGKLSWYDDSDKGFDGATCEELVGALRVLQAVKLINSVKDA